MHNRCRQFLSHVFPAILRDSYIRFIKRNGYFGDYSSWEQACHNSTGYDSDSILKSVKDALLKVKSGEAVYERDSVIFDDVHYSWPLLVGMLWIASCNGNSLNLLDFGGSLGSSYFQNRMLLAHLQEFTWSVVEQEKFVECGREYFEDHVLKFYYTIEECLEEHSPEVILLSSVLPYIEQPYELLARVLRHKFPYIIIDRTPLICGEADRLTVQHVPPEIYEASYPAWILGKDKLVSLFRSDYEMVATFDAIGGSIFLGNGWAQDTGFIFRLKG